MHGRLGVGACAAAVAAAALALAAAAPPAGTAHAQDDEDVSGAIPEWVRIVFGYYADGLISDAELLAALQYLADQGILVISPAPAAEPAAPPMSEEAEWAADEAKLEDAVAERLRDDMQAFRVELRTGAYIPGEPADYDKAVEAGRAEIRAVEAYADTLLTAAADGKITDAEKNAIEDAGRAADDAAAASYEAFMETPMAPLLEFSGGMMDMFAGTMAGGTGGAPLGPPTAPASQAPSPAPAASGPPRSIATAAEASDEADYLADLAKNQRKHLRNFELGLAGSDYRTTGDFGSAGSSAAYAADGNIAAYNPMIDATREAIRASEWLAGVLEDAADDGSISAAESREIAAAEAAATEAGTAAAAAYDATLYAQYYPGGVFASFMDGFR